MLATLNIVIVNWNSGKQLLDCLNSIVACNQENLHLNQVIVVDNASTDNSLADIAALPLPLKIINNSANKGFGFACNQGGRISDTDYILFLNPDTRLYRDSLTRPITFMQDPSHTDIGITGIQLIDENNHVARNCARFPKLGTQLLKIFGLEKFSRAHFMTEWDHMNNQAVDQVMGAFFLVRGKLYQQLNGFDERFFVYYEEVDFAFRAKQLGMASFYLADAQAFHAGGGTSRQVKAKRLFYNLRSRILYAFKHFNMLSAVTLLGATMIIEPVSRCVLALFAGSKQQVQETLSGYAMLWQELPALLKKAHKN